MRRWTLIVLALVLGLAMAVPATLNVVGQTPTPTAQTQAWVRLVNTSPDSPPVDLMNDGSTLFCNVPFTGVTRYAAVSSGSFTFRIVPVTAVSPVAGTPTSAATPAAAMTPTRALTPTTAATPTRVLTPTAAMTPTTALTPTTAQTPTTATPQATAVSPVSGTPTVVPSTPQALTGAQGIPVSGTLQPGQAYSMVVVGRQADAQTLILTDDLSAPPSGKVKVRFVHASPDAPAVDVSAGGTPLFSDVAYKSATDYMVADAGTVNLAVTPTGSTSAVLTVPNVVLNEGTVYTIYAEGLASGTPALQAVVAVESVGGMAVPTTP